MQQRRVGQQQHRKGRGRWYNNIRDSDSYNSTITIGGKQGGWDREESNIIKIK